MTDTEMVAAAALRADEARPAAGAAASASVAEAAGALAAAADALAAAAGAEEAAAVRTCTSSSCLVAYFTCVNRIMKLLVG